MNVLLSLPSLYQFRLVLAGISPMIWRRLVISSETSIAQLHKYIQTAFDWSGEHLHSLHIHNKDYGIAYLGGSALTTIPGLCGCLIFGCTRGNPSVTSTTSRPTGG
jgi:hypothetical protein